MIISIVPAKHIPNHLPRVRELLDRVKDLLDPYATPEDLITDCLAGDLTLWGIFDEELMGKEDPMIALVITDIRSYWRIRVMEFITIAGTGMKEWLGDFNSITAEYARESGCGKRLMPQGRTGWLRELKKYGWYTTGGVQMEADSA